MTDQTDIKEDETDAEGAKTAEEEGSGSAKRLSGKKLVLFFILPVLVVVGTATGVYFSGLADPYLSEYFPTQGGDGKNKPRKITRSAVFFDLPELLVNLNSTGRRTNFLKISISLELEKQSDIEQLELLLPRIIDSFQVYLRELRVNDLRGSAGIYRLREDLLRRVSEAVKPVKVNDVLFKEMLVQ